MKQVVGVADMKISAQADDVLVTHGLGSCLGIAVHDPVARVGGLLHVMMPASSINPAKAQDNPFMFVDTGVPLFFRQLYAAGAVKGRLKVKVAGGASTQDTPVDRFAIGKRNHIILRKMLWQNGVLIDGEDVGGCESRTMYLDIGTGRVVLHMPGGEKEL